MLVSLFLAGAFAAMAPKRKRPSKKRSDDKLEHKWQLKRQRQAYEDTFI